MDKEDFTNYAIYCANITSSFLGFPGNFLGGVTGLALKISDDADFQSKEAREEIRGYAMGIGALDTAINIRSLSHTPNPGALALGGLETVADISMMYALIKDQEKSTGLTFGNMLKVTGRYYKDRISQGYHAIRNQL